MGRRANGHGAGGERDRRDGGGRDVIAEQEARWRRETLAPSLERDGERSDAFTTQAMHWPVESLYGPSDLAGMGFDYLRDLGFPGEYPYTRGTTPNGYRSGLWNMLQAPWYRWKPSARLAMM